MIQKIKIWLIEGGQKKLDAYFNYINKESSNEFPTLITWDKPPGRLMWRRWWITKKIQSFIFKLRNRKKINKFNFPIIKRSYSNQIVKELISWQPMSAPTSPIFILHYIKENEDDTI